MCNAPLFGYFLFPDNICQAEQDIAKHDSASVAPGPGPGAQQHTTWRSRNRYRPSDCRESITSTGQQSQQPWLQFGRSNRSRGRGRGRGSNPRFPSPVSTPNINDNYCTSLTSEKQSVVQSDQVLSLEAVNVPKVLQDHRLLFKTQSQIVSCPVACHVPFAGISGPSQKKGVSPDPMRREIKHVKDVSCVVPCPFAPSAQSAPSVVNSLAMGGRLQNFWQVWEKLGSNPRVVSILKEGYMLPFKMRPPLTRSPVVRSGYANPVKNRFLKEALTALMQKLVVEKVVVRSSLAFYKYQSQIKGGDRF